jgi:phosphatidylserine decarboxylase
MVMIPVGMVEVSTCEFSKKWTDQMDKDPNSNTWTPKPNTTVSIKKGEELGMFHFGGSTHVLVFGPQVHLKFWQRAMPLDTEDNYFVPLNATIADVVPKDAQNSIYNI